MSTDNLFFRHGGIFLVCKINYATITVETPLCLNIDIINHHVEVNLESREDMLCGTTTTMWKSNEFIGRLNKLC